MTPVLLKKSFVFLISLSFLAIVLVPLELYPHSHDGTEPPIHNTFSFIPNQITEAPYFTLEFLNENILFGESETQKQIQSHFEQSIRNKSPPYSV